MPKTSRIDAILVSISSNEKGGRHRNGRTEELRALDREYPIKRLRLCRLKHERILSHACRCCKRRAHERLKHEDSCDDELKVTTETVPTTGRNKAFAVRVWTVVTETKK